MDQYFIKKKLEAKIVQFFLYIKTTIQLAIFLTKVVSSKMFYNSLDKLAIKDIYAST
jgi:hypothetical protein